MLDFDPMTVSTALSAAVVALGFGALSYWANPRRAINKAFLLLSIHVALWLMSLEIALGGGPTGLFFVRLTSAVAALIPATLWMVIECVVAQRGRWQIFRRVLPWFIAGLALGVLCFTDWFVPAHSTWSRRLYGPLYYAYMVAVGFMYVGLGVFAVRKARSLSGVQRMEMQVLLLGSCSAALSVIALMAASAINRSSIYIHFQPIVILCTYGATAWAMMSTKVFDAKHLLAHILHKLTLVTLVAVGVWALQTLGSFLLPDVLAYVVAVAISLYGLSEADPFLRSFFGLTSASGAAARTSLYQVSRQDYRPEMMAQAYADVLSGWGQTDKAYVLTNEKGLFEFAGLSLDADGPEVRSLSRLCWATPERLSRHRISPDIEALHRFMLQHDLGGLAVSPGKKLRVILGLGLAASRRPFTYPQLQHLVEFAWIVEGGMERAHYSLRARRSEQLATVGVLGASLAHEIRNPLVTLKTFAQLFPLRYNDPVFREKFQGMLTDEVTRIEQLTEQLLDMASPHQYLPQKVSLNQVAETCLELLAAKARSLNVQLKSDLQAKPDMVMTDPHAARQVLLNLCINGLQAMENLSVERWLLLSTRDNPRGVELSVTDNGMGIPPDMRPKLFQPFATSKSSGFGLGLAICSDILASLGATISADPDAPGRGATFRIVFPRAEA